MEENFLKRGFDSFATKTVLTLLGVVGTIITIYAFVQEKKVELKYEVISNTNVLDFNADINKLEVFYDSTNLKQTKENLRIYTIKISNKGDQNIIKEFYDENDPVGVKINSGKIIEQPQLIQASNEYLYRNIKFKNFQKNQVSFSQAIIESGESFTIKLLVLHKMDSIPQIISFGKIAGQKRIEVLNTIESKEDGSFLSKVYLGNIWVQLLRVLSYFIFGFILIIVIVVVSEKIDSVKRKSQRTKKINEFKSIENYQYTKMDDAIFDRYIEDDSHSFYRMAFLLNEENELNYNYVKLKKLLNSKEYRRFRKWDNEFALNSEDFSIINEMLKDGILFKEEDKLVINQAMKDSLRKFISFLEEKKLLKKDKYESFNAAEYTGEEE